MFLMSSKTPNTKGDKLCNEGKSRKNHSVIGLWYTIVHTRFKYLIINLNIFIVFFSSFEGRIDTEIKEKKNNLHKCN